MDVKKFFVAIIFAALIGVNYCRAAEVLATTNPDSEGWLLGLMQQDNGRNYFGIFNHKTKQGAWVLYERKIYDFYLNESPIIFIMGVVDSPRDVDENFGEWTDKVHLLPVYALFNYENGQVTLDSYLSSGKGLHPSHYQGRIQSPYHIKLAEIFLTHMPELHKVVDGKGINLP